MSADDNDQLALDRHALEVITGRPFDAASWPADAMTPGTRVRVTKDPAWDGPWRHEFVGTIDATLVPCVIMNPHAHEHELEYSVDFDEPQLDAGGDGPYRKAVIWARYLEPLPPDSATARGDSLAVEKTIGDRSTRDAQALAPPDG